MKRAIKTYLISAVLIFLLIIFSSLSFSQEAQKIEPVAPSAIPSEAGQAPAAAGLQTQWRWGTVVSLDANTGQVLLRYLDYETNSEKEITIYTEPKTTYENVTGFGEIKPKDNVSIDYIISADGKNIAKNISVEKLESIPAEEGVSSEPAAPSESEIAPE